MVAILKSEVPQARENMRQAARPWARTGSLDVEALVAWAYGVQMVDRFERAGLHAIEAAASGFEPRGLSSDGVGQLMEIHHLGARVDRGGVVISDAVHPVAYAVAAALGGVEGRDLVRAHGLAGTRPTSWVPPEHRVRPAMWAKPGEAAVVEYQGPGRKGGYCNVLYIWDSAREAWGRGVYRRWWVALDDLAWALRAKPIGFSVTGPAAPVEPWADGEGQGAPPSGSSQAPQT